MPFNRHANGSRARSTRSAESATAGAPIAASATRSMHVHACAFSSIWTLADNTGAREKMASLCGMTAPCTMIWGEKDHSHRCTNPKSPHECIPQADIVHFEDCGHFPDIGQPERFAGSLSTEQLDIRNCPVLNCSLLVGSEHFEFARQSLARRITNSHQRVLSATGSFYAIYMAN